MAATFPSYAIPSLAAGNRTSGSALVPRAAGSQSTETLTSQIFLNGLGANVSKLGPLISASKRTWGDIDLHTVNSVNAMMLSDTLQYKLNTQTGASFLTGVLAPKVMVPPNINTFKGRSYTYNIVPATVVPKRGTVRSMTKTLQEWQTSMRQSGIGSQIEGGAYRSPQGSVFLEQELIAFGLSLEMNVCLSTAETAIITAITRPFRDPSRQDVTEVVLGLQIAREIETFCCAGGDSSYFSNIISKVLATIPSASLMMAPLSLTQSLRFNDVGPPVTFANQTVSMVNQDGTNQFALTKNGTSASLYTIIGGRLAVAEMPVFTFLENSAPYQPLEHAMVTTEYTVLGPDRGLSAWYEVVPNNLAGPQMQDYSSKNLSNFAFDHNHNGKTEIAFSNALKHTYLFALESSNNRYQTNFAERRKGYDTRLLKTYTPELNNLINNQSSSSIVNVKEISTIFSRYTTISNATEYVEATTIKQASALQHKDINVVDDLQRVKRNLQFPLTSRVSANDNQFATTVNGKQNVCLPNCIGDLDPAHLSTNFFKCMVGDVQNTMYEILTCEGAALYKVLRSQILDTQLDETFFQALHTYNVQLGGDAGTYLCGNTAGIRTAVKNLYSVGNDANIFPATSWPLDSSNEFISLPPESLYKEIKQLNPANKTSGMSISKEFVPQGVWSARGLKYLAQSSAIGVGSMASSAKKILTYLACIWKQLCSMMPYTIFSNYTTTEQEAVLLGLGAPKSNDIKSGLVSDIDGMQIIMNMLDADVELYHVALNDKRSVSEDEFDIVYGGTDFTPSFYTYDRSFHADIVTGSNDAITVKFSNNTTTASIAFGKLNPNAIKMLRSVFAKFRQINTGDVDYVQKLISSVKKDTGAGESDVPLILYIAGIFIHVSNQLVKQFKNQSSSAFESPFTDSTFRLKPSVSANVLFQKIAEQIKTTNSLMPVGVSSEASNIAHDGTFHSTGLVVSARQLTSASANVRDYVKFYTKFGLARGEFKSTQSSGQSSDTLRYRDLFNKLQRYARRVHIFSNFQVETTPAADVCHTYWFEKRAELLADVPMNNSDTDWDTTLRMISSFLLHTQFNYNAVNKMILSQIRPPFDIACWRSPCHLMQGVLLAEPGLSTMFNPYTNPHTGMGRDANTDQYQIRAVIETATVVLNPNKLAFIGGVKPVAYCGGRNNKFISDPSMLRTLDDQGVHQPSLIACVVSHGYMPTTVEEPISFINRPPCAVTNGVAENIKETQRWPGAHYYGRTVYGSMFKFVSNGAQIAPSMPEEQQHRAYMEWLLSNTTTGHIGFRMNVNVYDPNTNSYSYNIPGTGHIKSDAFNSTGAKDYFEGKSTTPINMKFQQPSNYM